MKIPFSKADILLPENADMSKWAVIACDQYTSEPEYWEDVTKIVGDEPSTLKVTLPEIYLEEDNVAEKIAEVNEEMKKLINNNFFRTLKDSLIYVERTQADGRIRKGLMGKVDLEDYSFAKDSQTLIRATEGTVLERIPPRVKVRENAPLELPHIMLLIDDDKKEIIEGLTEQEVRVEIGQTMAFIVLALSELTHVFNIRNNKKSIFKTNIFNNSKLILAILTSSALMFVILLIPSLRSIFSIPVLPIGNIVEIVILVLMPIVIVEIFKLFKINTIGEE